MRWAIGFFFCAYFSTSNASPNDSKIVIIVVIIIGEAVQRLHGDGIIAQRLYFGGVVFIHGSKKVVHANTYQWGSGMLSECKARQV